MLISTKTSTEASACEVARLRALEEYSVLGTPPEPDLDRLVELAARMFGTPVAILSLVGSDRLYFKSRFGVEGTGLDRAGSFCAHAITQDGLFLVPDASKDDRFASHPIVADAPHVRLYAGVPLVAPGGEKIGMLCILDTKPWQSFTEDDRKNLEDVAALVMNRLEICRLDKARQGGHLRFERIASTSPDAIVCANASGIINYWNKSAETLLGYANDEVFGRPIGFLFPERLHRRQTDDLMGLVDGDASERSAQRIELIVRRKDASEFPAELTLSISPDGDDAAFGAILRDVSDGRQGEQRLFELADLDALTGLPNRARLLANLEEAAQANAGTLMLLDLAGFKDINDTLGHSVGDAILRQTAQRLRAAVEGSGNVARLGADEFAVLLPRLTDSFHATKVADELLRTFNAPFDVEAERVHLGVNIGVAICPQHGARAEELLANTNLALQRAKSRRASGYLFFTPKLREVVLARRSCEAELRKALANGEFELRYQPQVALSDRRIIGAEALLRWRHPVRGLLAPAAFLSVLESGPLAPAIGEWVLNTACADVANWRRMGIPDFRVAVNLFGAQFDAGNLPTRVEQALLANGLPAQALELEITENIMLRREETIIIPLREMCAWGVGIAFDDYGTGFASLSLLKRYPVTRLKIDRSFVRDMCADEEDAAIVQAVIYLGRCFGLGVIAEGIETDEQEEALKMYGCTEAQGYLYGEPLAAEVLTRYLGQERERTVA